MLLIDNLILTGQTMSQLLAIVENLGATIVGIGALWSAGGSTIGDTSIYAPLNDSIPAWAPDDCPLCAEREVPLEVVSY